MFLTRGFIFTYEAVREWEAKLTRTRAIDRDGALVDVMLSEHRNLAAAKAFFRSAKTVTGITPARVTTDGHDAYPLPFWRRHRLRRQGEPLKLPKFRGFLRAPGRSANGHPVTCGGTGVAGEARCGRALVGVSRQHVNVDCKRDGRDTHRSRKRRAPEPT